MSSSEFTNGQYAQRRRADKARELARWCYQRGIGLAVVEQPPQVLRAPARAAGVSPPHLDDLGRSPTWQLVGELLGRPGRLGPLPRPAAPIACAVRRLCRPAGRLPAARGENESACRAVLQLLSAAGPGVHRRRDGPAPQLRGTVRGRARPRTSRRGPAVLNRRCSVPRPTLNSGRQPPGQPGERRW